MRTTLAVLLVVLVAACAGGDDDGDGAAPASTSSTAAPSTTTTAEPADERTSCTPARGHEPGMSTATVMSGGIERTYLLHVPPSYDGRSPVPVVLSFHGHGSNAEQQMVYADLRPVADREGFLVVAPEGQGSPRHWNLLDVPEGEGDDVAFTNDLLDQLGDELCIDEQRLYSTGLSMGGGMTSVLACRASDRIAAFVTVALVIRPLCTPTRPVALMSFHGDADPVVPYAGGTVACCGNPTLPPQPDSVAKWAAADGCDPDPVDEQASSEVTVRRWTGCDEGGEVVFWTIVGGGHVWPGTPIKIERLGFTTDQVSASEEAWAFFQVHPLRN